MACLYQAWQAPSQASEASTFLVAHVHPGFPVHCVEGVVSLSPNVVAYGESGKYANPDDNFRVSCNDVVDINGNSTGDASDRHHMLFHIKLTSKNFNFEITKDDYQQLKRAFLATACPP